MKKYQVEHSNAPFYNEELNSFSEEGKDLLSFTYNSDIKQYVYIFEIKDTCQDDQTDNLPIVKTTNNRFEFKTSLVALGVHPQTAEDWIKVRRAKRAAQTETSFRTVASQARIISDTYGVTPDDVIRVAVERNWQGVLAKYYENIDWSDYGIQTRQTKLSFDKNNDWQ